MIFVLLIALKTGSVMSELAILLARVFSLSKLSTYLLKCLLKVFASSLLLLIVLLFIIQNNRFFVKSLLREERTDSFLKFSIVGDNSMVYFSKKTSFILAEQANTEISLAVKASFRFLVSSF